MHVMSAKVGWGSEDSICNTHDLGSSIQLASSLTTNPELMDCSH